MTGHLLLCCLQDNTYGIIPGNFDWKSKSTLSQYVISSYSEVTNVSWLSASDPVQKWNEENKYYFKG
jgi:hypothetical protein